ncbi:MAG: hypothetical protein PHR35_18030 [Kiritimatiellae bacterium]|nr:hypothetical protein [Kiritimatiellia bacterium]
MNDSTASATLPPPPPIRRLRRIYSRGHSLSAIQSLWQADDHLLVVQHIYYTEKYQRLFFRDIESMIVQPSTRRLIINIVLGLLLVPAIFMMVLMDDGVWFGGAVVLALCVPLLINTLLGPGCRCEVCTRVNTVRLRGLTRLRRALREMDRLSVPIARAQGAYDAQAHRSALAPPAPAPAPADDAAARIEAPVAPAAPSRRRVAPTPLLVPDDGIFHRILIAALTLETLAIALFLNTGYAGLLTPAGVTILLTFLLTFVVLSRSARRTTSVAWRRWTWANFGYQILRGLSLYVTLTVLNVVASVRHPAAQGTMGVDIEGLAGHAFVRGLLTAFAAISVASALWGVFALRRGAAARNAAPPPLPPPPEGP